MVKKLFKWQQKQGLNDRQLAEILGCDNTMISHVRAGRKKFTIKIAKKLPVITDHYITVIDVFKYF